MTYQPHESELQKESQTLHFVFKKNEQPELMKSTVTAAHMVLIPASAWGSEVSITNLHNTTYDADGL